MSGGVQRRRRWAGGAGGVEGLMRAEPAEQLSGTTCPTIALCLFSRRGSLDPPSLPPSLTTAAELPPSPISTYLHYCFLCFYHVLPSSSFLQEASFLASYFLRHQFFLPSATPPVHFTLDCFTSSVHILTTNVCCFKFQFQIFITLLS